MDQIATKNVHMDQHKSRCISITHATYNDFTILAEMPLNLFRQKKHKKYKYLNYNLSTLVAWKHGNI